MQAINKGQVVIMSLFVVGMSMIISLMLLFPIISQSLRAQSLINVLQALANAEAGIEVGNLYAIKGFEEGDIEGIEVSTSTPSDFCNEFYSDEYYRCVRQTITNPLFFESQIDAAVDTMQNVLASRNVSRGNYKNVSRILIFLFYPQ